MPDRAAEFTIPQDALLESFRLLALEGVSFSDYAEAVAELISELLDRGLLFRRPGGGTNSPKNITTRSYTRSIRAVFAEAADRRDVNAP